MDHLSKKWTLKSLTIGPQPRKTSNQFLEEALNGLPPLPHVANVTIVHNYAGNNDYWRYFDRILSRRDLFPALEYVWARPGIGRPGFSYERWWEISCAFNGLRSRGLTIRKVLAFERDPKTDNSHGT